MNFKRLNKDEIQVNYIIDKEKTTCGKIERFPDGNYLYRFTPHNNTPLYADELKIISNKMESLWKKQK